MSDQTYFTLGAYQGALKWTLGEVDAILNLGDLKLSQRARLEFMTSNLETVKMRLQRILWEGELDQIASHNGGHYLLEIYREGEMEPVQVVPIPFFASIKPWLEKHPELRSPLTVAKVYIPGNRKLVCSFRWKGDAQAWLFDRRPDIENFR